MDGLLTMSKKEIRLMIITHVEENKITVFEAAELLELSQRQVYRILKE